MTEGLRIARLLMVLSSISPLFILWAIRGSGLIPDLYFVTACLLLVFLPNLFLWLRIRTAKRLKEKRQVFIGRSEDHRDHLLVYLFTMLLPFYTADLATWRDIATAIVGICFIIFLFWHLNLHYMNLAFALFGFRVFTVYPPKDNNILSGKFSFILITRRVNIVPGDRLSVYRLSDTVFLEINE